MLPFMPASPEKTFIETLNLLEISPTPAASLSGRIVKNQGHVVTMLKPVKEC